MPQLVRTPEQVLRETKQDLYLIKFMGGEPPFGLPINILPGRKELFAWFKRELPHVQLEDLGPYEDSGVILGGIGILVRIAFDEASLAKYVEAWENKDGSSKDPRWACYIYPYQYYLERKSSAKEPEDF